MAQLYLLIHSALNFKVMTGTANTSYLDLARQKKFVFMGQLHLQLNMLFYLLPQSQETNIFASDGAYQNLCVYPTCLKHPLKHRDRRGQPSPHACWASLHRLLLPCLRENLESCAENQKTTPKSIRGQKKDTLHASLRLLQQCFPMPNYIPEQGRNSLSTVRSQLWQEYRSTQFIR